MVWYWGLGLTCLRICPFFLPPSVCSNLAQFCVSLMSSQTTEDGHILQSQPESHLVPGLDMLAPHALQGFCQGTQKLYILFLNGLLILPVDQKNQQCQRHQHICSFTVVSSKKCYWMLDQLDREFLWSRICTDLAWRIMLSPLIQALLQCLDF
jgi:hypothetical protein